MQQNTGSAFQNTDRNAKSSNLCTSKYNLDLGVVRGFCILSVCLMYTTVLLCVMLIVEVSSKVIQQMYKVIYNPCE